MSKKNFRILLLFLVFFSVSPVFAHLSDDCLQAPKNCEDLVRFHINESRMPELIRRSVVQGIKKIEAHALEKGAIELPESLQYQEEDSKGRIKRAFIPKSIQLKDLKLGQVKVNRVSGQSSQYDLKIPIKHVKMKLSAGVGGRDLGGLVFKEDRPISMEVFEVTVDEPEVGSRKDIPSPYVKVRVQLGADGHLINIDPKEAVEAELDLRTVTIGSDPQFPLSKDLQGKLSWITGSGARARLGRWLANKFIHRSLKEQLPEVLGRVNLAEQVDQVLSPNIRLSNADLNRIRLQALLSVQGETFEQVRKTEARAVHFFSEQVASARAKVNDEVIRKQSVADHRNRYTKLAKYLKNYEKELKNFLKRSKDMASEVKREFLESEKSHINELYNLIGELRKAHIMGLRRGKGENLRSQSIVGVLEDLDEQLDEELEKLGSDLAPQDLFHVQTVVNQLNGLNVKVAMGSPDCTKPRFDEGKVLEAQKALVRSGSDMMASVDVDGINEQLARIYNQGLLRACLSGVRVIHCGTHTDTAIKGELRFDGPPQVRWDPDKGRLYLAFSPRLKGRNIAGKVAGWVMKGMYARTYLNEMGPCEPHSGSLCFKGETEVEKKGPKLNTHTLIAEKTGDYLQSVVAGIVGKVSFGSQEVEMDPETVRSLPVQIDKVQAQKKEIRVFMTVPEM